MSCFGDQLQHLLKANGHTAADLANQLRNMGFTLIPRTLNMWILGRNFPKRKASLDAVRAIEDLYDVPSGWLLNQLPSITWTGALDREFRSDKRLKRAWRHLPPDFAYVSQEKRAQILDWVDVNVLGRDIVFNRRQRTIAIHPYRVKFTNPFVEPGDGIAAGHPRLIGKRTYNSLGPRTSGLWHAPEALDAEARDLIAFKTDTLTESGLKRSSKWNEYTAIMTLLNFGSLFGALATSDKGDAAVKVPLDSLTFGMLAFPSVWRWYLHWSFARRDGKFTSSEVGFLSKGISLLEGNTGWMPQRPRLSERLVAVPGLISEEDIEIARNDWTRSCAHCLDELYSLQADVKRSARPERRPFALLKPILDSPNPLKEYLKIADEIRRRIPDEARHPRAAAIAVKAFLIFRLSIALGFRAKNMRELLIAQPGKHRSDLELEKLQRGELRWDEKKTVWKVFAPSIAFKNNSSSYFKHSPFELEIPDRGGLYELLDAYFSRHRPRLLAGKDDPGTVFIRALRSDQNRNAEYTSNAFHSAWRTIIQLYGIYNPYTKKGAIEGLLPHGPHCLRHVLATHVLKRTGSVEYASFAIQNAPWTVYEYYGQFLPRDKARIAGVLLDEVWGEEADLDVAVLPTSTEAFYRPRIRFIK